MDAFFRPWMHSSIAALGMLSAGSWVNAEETRHSTTSAASGRQLYLMNCAHCHAQDASGDEGPDLHDVKKSNARVAEIILHGIKGEMPRFGQKLHAADVQQLIQYLRSLSTN